MTNNPKISIIVPCYNASKYIAKCLQSIINQSYKNIEIICVNDGSTDNTLNILRKIQRKDKRIVIINKRNGGVSAARNDGIKKSVGDYILFVDSDDYIDEQMVELLVEKSIEHDSDIVKCNRSDVYLRDNFIIDRKPIWNSERVFLHYKFHNDIYPEFFKRNRLCSIWMTLIRKNVLVLNNVLFDEDLVVNEDEVFASNVFTVANKFVYLPNNLYYYVKKDSGLSTNGVDIFKRFDSRKKHSLFILDLAKKWKIDNLEEVVKEKISFLGIHTLFQTAASNANYSKKTQFKLFKNIINDEVFYENIKKSKGKIMLFPEKILLFLIKIHFYIIGFMYARCFENFLRKYRYNFERLIKR